MIFEFLYVFDCRFSQMKRFKSAEVTFGAALEMKFVCSCLIVMQILKHHKHLVFALDMQNMQNY